MNGLFIAAAAAHAAAGTRQAESTARRASAKASELRTEVEFMKMDIEKLLMVTESLWGILKEQHGYSDGDLIQRIEKIDLRDGKLDGKVAKQGPSVCPNCSRTLIGNRPVCLYCGTPITRHPFER